MPVKTIFVRLALLFAPLVIWQIVELFVLPIDFFTFRFWEALSTQRVFVLPGHFYPEMYLEKYSAGDQVRHGPRKKLIRFRSDAYGFRNPPEDDSVYEIVIVGDSNIAGSHIDEPNTIRAQLELRCNCKVYSYGYGLPSNIRAFLEDDRFRVNPPKYVVFEFRPSDVESGVMQIYQPCPGSAYPNRTFVARLCDSVDSGILQDLKRLRLMEHPTVLIYIDRFFKQPSYQFLHARLRLTARPNTNFGQAGVTPADDRTGVERSKEALRSYRAALNQRGSKLILFSMPTHTDYESSIPVWISELREESFDVISIESSSTPPDILSSWWMKEDSHWREESISFSAGLILKGMSALSEKSNLPTH